MSDAGSPFQVSSDVTSAGMATRSVPPVCAPVGAGVAVAGGAWQATPNSRASASAGARRTGDLVRLEAGVERVAQAVADEVEAEHGEKDHGTRRDDKPPCAHEVRRRVRQHVDRK